MSLPTRTQSRPPEADNSEGELDGESEIDEDFDDEDEEDGQEYKYGDVDQDAMDLS
jgi:hypothetical protein